MNYELSKSFKLLLVEDSPLDVKLVHQAILDKNADVEIIVLSDGAAAIDFFSTPRAAHVDLVLLDLNLPLRNGLEVLGEMRSMTAFRFLPVVVYTTSNASDQVQQAYHRGANAYFRKPIDALEFIDCIGTMISFWFGTATLPPRDA